jgi:SAM-dependent methyltransferase
MSTYRRTKSNIIILPHLSAIAPKNANPSRAVTKAIQALKQFKVRHVCEIGCGLLANTPHILRSFQKVILTDRKEQLPRIEAELKSLESKYSSFEGFVNNSDLSQYINYFDAAIIINVLHILPTPKHRLSLLKAVNRTLKHNGIAFVDVPRNEYYYRALVKTATKYNDGYIMRRGSVFTFYRNMDFDELEELTQKAGFTIHQRVYIDHRNSLVVRKKK